LFHKVELIGIASSEAPRTTRETGRLPYLGPSSWGPSGCLGPPGRSGHHLHGDEVFVEAIAPTYG